MMTTPIRSLNQKRRLVIPLIAMAMLIAAVLAGATTPALTLAASPQKAAVTGLTITDGGNAGEALVSWDAHPETAQVYRLAWAPGEGNFRGKNNSDWNAFPTSTSHTVTGVDEGTAYKFKVRAKFASPPVSNWSQRVTFTTSETADTPTPPPQVRSAQAAQQKGQTPVTVSWSASDGATKYQVERQNNPSGGNAPVTTDIEGGATTSHQDSSTDYNTSYLYRVRAGNDAGYGTWSRSVRITTNREPGTPAAPGSFTGSEASPGTVSVSWTAPDGTDALTGYKVYRRTVGTGDETILATLGADQTSHTDATVAAETIYFYWVRAYNSTGDSPESRRETITTQVQTQGVPNAPGRPSLSEATPGEVVARWTAPAGGADPTQYKLYRQKVGESNNDVIATVDATVLTHTDDTVEEETWYYYQLRAVNDSGESTADRFRLIKTTVQTPGVPNAPKRVDATEDTAGEVVVTWNAPTSGETLTGYSVYRRPILGTYAVIGTTAADVTTYTDDTVEPEIWYDYTVRATNDAGNSAEGGMETIKTKVQTEGAPPAPEDTEADQ